MFSLRAFFQAIVLEGKYWKRRMESVTAEYKKWRLFYKKKFAHDNRGMLDVIEVSALYYSKTLVVRPDVVPKVTSYGCFHTDRKRIWKRKLSLSIASTQY